MNGWPAFIFAIALLVGPVVAVPLALLALFRQRNSATWPTERFCSNPRCGDPDWDHDEETPGGACRRLGCTCRRFEP